MKFDFDDILIQPAITTGISSRKDINPFNQIGFLPLITAPMDTVIDSENELVYKQNKIIPCQPRGVKLGGIGFESYSLNEFDEKFLNNGIINVSVSGVLIDIANGHMASLLSSVTTAKSMYGEDLVLMVGNVAHPRTYSLLSEAGADYVRVGIGNGGGCLTTQQLGIGYPMGSLVRECYLESCKLNSPAKIVADGGMKKYSDIIKALALGADYVMLGSILAKSIDSCGAFYEKGNRCKKLSKDEAKLLFENGSKIKKTFRGMSTKEVQKDWGREELKTSEGVSRIYDVEYSLSGWIENFESYLRSAMSYTNSTNLDEFIGKVNYNLITNNAYNRFKK